MVRTNQHAPRYIPMNRTPLYVLAGFSKAKKEEMKKEIEHYGGDVTSSPSNKAWSIVVPDGTKSDVPKTKIQELGASKFGLPTITESQMWTNLKHHFAALHFPHFHRLSKARSLHSKPKPKPLVTSLSRARSLTLKPSSARRSLHELTGRVKKRVASSTMNKMRKPSMGSRRPTRRYHP